MQRVIRKSKESDIEAIMAIIADAQAFLRSCGVDQWQDGYPTAEIIANDIAAGHSYVLEQQGVVVATAVISTAGESTYSTIEGRWLNDNPYVVVHRLAVSASVQRTGAARELMLYAQNIALESHLADLRVDTHADNLVMQRLLSDLGYRYCGIITLESGSLRRAYQLTL